MINARKNPLSNSILATIYYAQYTFRRLHWIYKWNTILTILHGNIRGFVSYSQFQSHWKELKSLKNTNTNIFLQLGLSSFPCVRKLDLTHAVYGKAKVISETRDNYMHESTNLHSICYLRTFISIKNRSWSISVLHICAKSI